MILPSCGGRRTARADARQSRSTAPRRGDGDDGSGFSSWTSSATPVMSSMRRSMAEGERMVSAPPERLWRDARAASTPSPQPFMKSNSARSKTRERCRSMTASKMAPSSGALMRSTSPRTVSTAPAFSKATVRANSPKRSLAVVTSASQPLVSWSASRGLPTTQGELPRMGHPREMAKGMPAREADNASGDSTGLDTRSFLRMAADLSGRPRRPSLSKVSPTLHLGGPGRQGRRFGNFPIRLL